MKLGVIKHVRCGEEVWGSKTLVWLPDAMTQAQFEKAVNAAADAYLAFIRSYDAESEKSAPNDYRPHGGGPYYRNQPHRTVADMDAEWAAKRTIWEVWDKRRQEARKTFGAYLEGREGIQRFWEHEADFTMDVNWGHNHGVRLDYDETEFD